MCLSFVGWVLLAMLPAVIVATLVVVVSGSLLVSGVLPVLSAAIGIVCFAPAVAYVYSALAGFYEIVSGGFSLVPELGFKM